MVSGHLGWRVNVRTRNYKIRTGNWKWNALTRVSKSLLFWSAPFPRTNWWLSGGYCLRSALLLVPSLTLQFSPFPILGIPWLQRQTRVSLQLADIFLINLSPEVVLASVGIILAAAWGSVHIRRMPQVLRKLGHHMSPGYVSQRQSSIYLLVLRRDRLQVI